MDAFSQLRRLSGAAICFTFVACSVHELAAQNSDSSPLRALARGEDPTALHNEGRGVQMPQTADSEGVTLGFENGELVSLLQESEQPEATIEEATAATFTSVGSPFSGFEALASLSSEGRVGASSASVSDAVIGGEQALARASRDTGTILLDSTTTTNISLFRRPIISQPYIRGFNNRQIYSQLNGGHWLETRFDLDTIVSKIDSGIIRDVVIIKGPYSALYGPQLSFIDVVTAPTIRSGCCGVVSEFRTVSNFDDNGDTWYARQVAQVGGANWGARFSAGGRGGVDYKTGLGNRIDANFQQRDIDMALGYDLANGGNIEFQYVRADMDDTLLSNQLFDIDALKTDGFTLRYQNDCSSLADRVMLDTWYNRSDVAASSPTTFSNGVNTVAGSQDSSQASLGYRASLRYGDPDCDCKNTIVGTDLRYSKHEIIETDLINGTPGFFDLPDSSSVNPGFFVQREVERGYTRYQFGGRLDYVDDEVGAYRGASQGPGAQIAQDREFFLYSAFLTGERDLNQVWTATFGVGHGQRAPGLIELYADDPFMAITQQGTASVRGNSFLEKEAATQVDIGLRADYCRARFGVRGYYTWIEDYITYGQNINAGVPGAFLLYPYVNSDSEFAGVEFNSEFDVTDELSLFGNLGYTYGSDQGLFNEPVYGIYPFDSRVGARFQYGDECRGYGFEISARIVDGQDRFATSRGELPTGGFTTGDLRAYLRLRPGVLLTAGITNFADRLVLEHFDYRGVLVAKGLGNPASPSFQPGRNYYMGGELTY